jgi:hypothetical protein
LSTLSTAAVFCPVGASNALSRAEVAELDVDGTKQADDGPEFLKGPSVRPTFDEPGGSLVD